MKHLIGSATTLKQLQFMVQQYFYSPSIELVQAGEHLWEVKNRNGLLDNYRVIKVKTRFRFECEILDQITSVTKGSK